jgi:MFS family permease
MHDRRTRLSLLWIFVLFNYLYCDLVGLMDSELLRQYLTGRVGGMDLDQGFLLGASVLMELPMAMILVSRLAPERVNRWANVVAGGVMTAVQAATLLAGTPTAYYAFFSVIEIGCTLLIVRSAWTWHPPPAAPVTTPAVEVQP